MMVDFIFSSEQKMMAATLRGLLDDLCSPAAIRAAAARPAEDGGRRWNRLSELGLARVLAPVAAGGMGLADVDMVLLAEEAGHAALPDAFIEHAGIAIPMLAELAGHRRAAAWLERAASGKARIAMGHDSNPCVLDGAQADVLLLMHGEQVHLVERSQVQLHESASMDRLRSLWRVAWSPNPGSCIAEGAVGRHAWARAAARGALYSAAQCAGLTDRLLELSVAYTSGRAQFGKPIGSYQALKHQLANVRVKLEFARALLYGAVTRVHELDERSSAMVSSAKVAAGDAADLGARSAIQVHGAMGYSWEVDLHFYAKRAWALNGAWGDRNSHARRVQTLILGGHVAAGPGETFGGVGT